MTALAHRRWSTPEPRPLTVLEKVEIQRMWNHAQQQVEEWHDKAKAQMLMDLQDGWRPLGTAATPLILNACPGLADVSHDGAGLPRLFQDGSFPLAKAMLAAGFLESKQGPGPVHLVGSLSNGEALVRPANGATWGEALLAYDAALRLGCSQATMTDMNR